MTVVIPRASFGMDRRHFLRTGGAAFVALSVPGWTRVFGQVAPEGSAPAHGDSALRKAIERARSRGLPLLLLRAPADAAQRNELGLMWGAYLSLASSYRVPGSRSQCLRLADLAMCEIVCAMDADVIREMPSLAHSSAWTGALALIVEPEDSSIFFVPGPVIWIGLTMEYADRQAAKQYLLLELGERLRSRLAIDLEMLKRRARANFARLTTAQKSAWAKLGQTSASDVWRVQSAEAPACLRLFVDTSDALGQQALASLARATANRLENPIEGARWEPWWEQPGERIGCGMGPCGTGSAPAPSVRFLRYYTDLDSMKRQSQEEKPRPR